MMPLYESVKDYNCHEEQKKHITKSQTHCNSCGAPINPNHEKCEYCGTYYAVSSNMPVKLNQAKTDFETSLEKFKRAMKASMISPDDIRRQI